MSRCGLDRVDALFESDPAARPLAAGDCDAESAGAVQDLLRAHGYSTLPTLLSSDFGLYGPKTAAAVRDFRSRNGLPPADAVDGEMLRKLLEDPAESAMATRPYVTLALDVPWNAMTKVLLLTTMLEGNGSFGAMCLNKDGAGLSFGIIQWAQKPGRLVELLSACRAKTPVDFTRIFGNGDEALAGRLMAHVGKPNGGVERSTGTTTDREFDLVAEPWVSRFTEAGRSRTFQAVQIATALEAFRKSYAGIQANAQDLKTERQIGFMLDLANQFGEGGARSVYSEAKRAGAADLLSAMAEISANRIDVRFRAGTLRRRMLFLKSPYLRDEPFESEPLSGATRQA